MLGLGFGLTSEGSLRRSGVVTPAWTPLDLGAALGGWLSADDHGTARMVDDGAGAISSWKDKVTGANFIGATTFRPTWASNSFNSSYAGVNFTTDDALIATPAPATWPDGAESVELWAVVDQKSLGADATSRPMFGYGSSAATSISLRRISSAGTNRWQITGVSSLTDATTNFSGPHIISGVAFGTSLEVWGDGASKATGAATVTATVNTRAVLGGNLTATPTIFAEICVRHLFVIIGTLTSAQKARLFGWAAWDAGLQSLLPTNHPYKTAAPTTAWNPWDLDTALKAWWSAADHGTALMTDDGAGLISSHTDKVGGMVITAITAERPTWGAASFNSAYPGLAFAGAQRLLSTTLTTLPTGAVPGSIFMVLSQDFTPAAAGSHYLLRYGSSGSGVDRALMRILSTQSRFRVSDGTAVIGDLAVTFDGPHIVSGSWSATAETGRIDGADISQGSVALTLATGAVRFALGAANGTTILGGATINVSDAIITTALTLLEHQKLEGWAAWDKGLTARLPVGHPYKSAAP